uniref:Chromosome 3 open reading frame 33 n=1 Tax=Nothoprocta perdicaria TaxID=30464 RepID=A0A8C6YRV3_NOTPE
QAWLPVCRSSQRRSERLRLPQQLLPPLPLRKVSLSFTSALDIPVEFVEKNVKLRGKIRHVTETGLEVEHVPISVPFLAALQRKCNLLLVRLAGVELTPGAVVWLQEELKPSQMIWFQLLGRQDLALECLVLVNKGRFLSTCLNEEILRQGLGRTARIEGLRHDSRLYWKLHKRLLRAELKAAKKNKGIWKEESAAGKMRDRYNYNLCFKKLSSEMSCTAASKGNLLQLILEIWIAQSNKLLEKIYLKYIKE